MSRGNTKRDDLLSHVAGQLRKNSTQSTLFDQAAAERLGLNSTDRNCLEVLVELGSATAGTLAELMSLTTGAITGVVDRLERQGYVKREGDPQDRRRVIIRPVLERMQSVGNIYKPLLEATQEMCIGYSDEQVELIMDFLARSEAMLHAETAKLRPQTAGAGWSQSWSQSETAGASGGKGPGDSVSIEGITVARLNLVRAGDMLNIAGDTGLATLFKGQFGHFDGKPPEVKVDRESGTVTIQERRRWCSGATHLQLNTVVPWYVSVESLSAKISADLREIRLKGATFKDKACEVNIKLPPPQGTIEIQLASRGSKITLDLPPGSAARLYSQAKDSSIKPDRRHFHSTVDNTWETPAYALAPNHYNITAQGWGDDIRVRVRG